MRKENNACMIHLYSLCLLSIILSLRKWSNNHSYSRTLLLSYVWKKQNGFVDYSSVPKKKQRCPRTFLSPSSKERRKTTIVFLNCHFSICYWSIRNSSLVYQIEKINIFPNNVGYINEKYYKYVKHIFRKFVVSEQSVLLSIL